MARTWVRGMASMALLTAVTGCVRPWERGALSHRSMGTDNQCEILAEGFNAHVYDIREGATGGMDRPGGGCGCN